MKPLSLLSFRLDKRSTFYKKLLALGSQSTYKNIEIIIINDKTTDESISIIKDVLQKEAPSVPIKIIEHAENKGLSSARKYRN